ncbi:MAG: hypothetical protein ABID54_00100 [Pseudomonadota bacterium]
METQKAVINLEDLQNTLGEKEMIILQLRSLIRSMDKDIEEKAKKISELEKEMKTKCPQNNTE